MSLFFHLHIEELASISYHALMISIERHRLENSMLFVTVEGRVEEGEGRYNLSYRLSIPRSSDVKFSYMVLAKTDIWAWNKTPTSEIQDWKLSNVRCLRCPPPSRHWKCFVGSMSLTDIIASTSKNCILWCAPEYVRKYGSAWMANMNCSRTRLSFRAAFIWALKSPKDLYANIFPLLCFA